MVDIGLGRKIASIVAKRLANVMGERSGSRPDAVTLSRRHFAAQDGDEPAPSHGLVSIDGSEGASIQLAACCRPIPGDDIVGYLGRGEGLTVHTAECSVGKRLYERDRERWLPVEWSEQPVRPFETAITVLVQNGQGVLARVAAAVSDAEADITHLDMGNEPANESAAELRLLLSVRDRQHLADVLRALKRAPAVLRLGRVKG